MSYSGTYELSERQYKVLVNAANGPTIVFAVLEPRENDSDTDRTELAACQHDSEALVTLGLAQDVSGKFTEQIEMSKINNKRAFKVYAITDAALTMFHNFGERPIN